MLQSVGTGTRLAEEGYAVFGIDYEGHGRSEGQRCYIQSFHNLVTDCVSFFRTVRGKLLAIMNTKSFQIGIKPL